MSNIQFSDEQSNFLKNEIAKYIKTVGDIGKDDEGGTTRLLFSESWYMAQEKVKEIMNEGGFSASYDTAGNLFGIFGGETGEKAVMCGSHIDTVKCGGHYDGLYGVLAALIAIRFLKDNYGTPKKPLIAVSVCEEESSRFSYSFFGSSNIIGNIDKEVLAKTFDNDGIHILDAMKKIGFHEYDPAKNQRTDIDKFVEIHIEQGGVLERENKSIGIVKKIVGQKRFQVTIKGEANHAGTTPLSYRKDCMYTASEFIYSLLKKADEYGEPLVATVGELTVFPGAPNVVPGLIHFTIDTRHPEADILEHFEKDIMNILEQAKKRKTEISIEKWMDEKPTVMDEDIQTIIEKTCVEQNLEYMHMYSGAGHDSEVMARKFDTAMIFVPSKNGVSHSPHEYTSDEDLAKGIMVLINVLYELAY